MKLSPLLGYCFISPDPPHSESKGGILYPNSLADYPRTGLCVAHSPTSSFDEDLHSKRVIFDRTACRLLTLQHDGKEVEFLVVSQYSVMAILEGGAE